MLGLIIIVNVIHIIEVVCIQILFLFKSYYNISINNTINHINYSHVDIYNSSHFYT
jgi:hypothetical protein